MRKTIIVVIAVIVCAIFINIIDKKIDKKANAIVDKIMTQNEMTILHHQLADLLKVYSVYDENGPLELTRHGKGNDGGYVVPIKALKLSDVLLGYGIANDNSFEDNYSLSYGKPSYGFDCGIDQIGSKSGSLFTFVNECIGNNKYLYEPNANQGTKKVTSFEQQLDNLKLREKNIFIKMDIEGAEYDAFNEIFKHSQYVTGIAIEIHFSNSNQLAQAVKLLKNLQKDFVLLHVHGNNCCPGLSYASNAIGKIPNVIELSYINKKLIKGSALSINQSHPTEMDQPNNVGSPDVEFEILN